MSLLSLKDKIDMKIGYFNLKLCNQSEEQFCVFKSSFEDHHRSYQNVYSLTPGREIWIFKLIAKAHDSICFDMVGDDPQIDFWKHRTAPCFCTQQFWQWGSHMIALYIFFCCTKFNPQDRSFKSKVVCLLNSRKIFRHIFSKQMSFFYANTSLLHIYTF